VFCDYHGHSRRKNVFLYGCSSSDSWCESDLSLPDNPADYLVSITISVILGKLQANCNCTDIYLSVIPISHKESEKLRKL
jgi:hypothetical protein